MPALVDLHRRRGSTPSPLLQLAFADLIERGEIDRHLRRQRRRYRRQREALLDALASELPDMEVQGAEAGLYVVLRLPADLDRQRVLDAARARGMSVESIEGQGAALVIGYANLPDAAVKPAVAELAESIRETG